MLVARGEEFRRLKGSLVESDWEKRDFVESISTYVAGKSMKVLVVSGLRGTGKTVGILQGVAESVLYLTAQAGETEDYEDYLEVLRDATEDVIVIDEYPWIRGRENLDAYLYTLVENGKRVIVSGTESIVLEYLNYGRLIHRVIVVQTNYFSYSEYRRLFRKEKTKESCLEFLRTGGVFEDYVIDSFSSLREYVKTAIIDNVSAYVGNEIDEKIVKAVVYTIFYKAICDSVIESVPSAAGNLDRVSEEEFLEEVGVDSSVVIDMHSFSTISEVMEKAGIVIRVANYRVRNQFRVYVVNQSMSYQLVRAIWGRDDLPDSMMGYLFECSCVVALKQVITKDEKLYYSKGRKAGRDFELDFIVVDEGRSRATCLFECKLSDQTRLPDGASLVSDVVEDSMPDNDVYGRFVIYNGKEKAEVVNSKEVCYSDIDSVTRDFRTFAKVFKRLMGTMSCF
jgi:predicted AAA+ superfamily ATPase